MVSRASPALAAFAAVLALAAASVAFADGDPASDALLGQNVFYPYSPPVTQKLQKTLDAETAAAKAAGFPIKVALIGSREDLGAIPSMFGSPQRYADFLDQEISFQDNAQPLLVVMPAGYGVHGMPAPVAAAAAKLAKPTGTPNEELATAAITAVAKLSAAAGHPLHNVAGVSSGGGGSSKVVIVAALAAAAVLAAGALLVLRHRGQGQAG